jgi:hypothetical protein
MEMETGTPRNWQLAPLNGGAHGGEGVAGEVEVVVAPAAVDVEEGHDDHAVEARVAGLAEGALVPVPAPEHRDLTGLPLRRRRAGEEEADDERDGEKRCRRYDGYGRRPPACEQRRHCCCR